MSKKNSVSESGPVLKDLRDIETEVNKIIKSRVPVEKLKGISIRSSNLIEVSGMAIYQIDGLINILAKPAGVFSGEEVDSKHFTMKFHALTGQLVGYEIDV